LDRYQPKTDRQKQDRPGSVTNQNLILQFQRNEYRPKDVTKPSREGSSKQDHNGPPRFLEKRWQPKMNQNPGNTDKHQEHRDKPTRGNFDAPCGLPILKIIRSAKHWLQ